MSDVDLVFAGNVPRHINQPFTEEIGTGFPMSSSFATFVIACAIFRHVAKKWN